MLSTFSRNFLFIYSFNVLQCPFVLLSGRDKLWHSAASGAIIGGVGVQLKFLSIPFVDPYFLLRNPRIPPVALGAVVYGGLGTAFGIMGGKEP